jgi:tetratricopeptide (TPR) repeat protein
MENINELIKFLFEEKGGRDKLMEDLCSLESDNEKVSYLYSCLDSKECFALDVVKSKKNEELALQAKMKGNACVAKNKLSSARRKYTESIAFAPLESETLAIAYANRSAVLYSMGYLKEAVADVHRALFHGYPVHLKHKVLARQGDCLKQLGHISQAFQSYNAAIDFLDQSLLQVEHKEAKRIKYAQELKMCKPNENIQVDTIKHDFSSFSLDPPPTLKIPELCFKQSEELLSVAECADLKYDEKVGRHIVANRDLQPGKSH